jgi:uncharacterized protein (TIGR03067 family)
VRLRERLAVLLILAVVNIQSRRGRLADCPPVGPQAREDIRMKTTATFTLVLGLLGLLGPAAEGQDKKAPKLEGKYTLVSGKRNGAAIDDESKKAAYSFTADKVTIKGGEVMFVMSYKIDPKTDPMNIDMEILEGPEGTKGSKAQGIIEVKDDTVKLAYSVEKDKRPKDFKGEKDFYFELKKAK